MTVTQRGATAASALPRELPLPDGLRGVAALMVLLTHTAFATGTYGSGAVGAVLARFDFGVALFFVLSGFLLTRPWVARGVEGTTRTRRYAVRRAARILPAYWVALLVVVVLQWGSVTAADVAVNAALLQVYTGDLLPLFTQTWSLCTEVAFYVVLPLLAPWVLHGWRRRRPGRRAVAARLSALVAVGLACTAASTAFDHVHGTFASGWLPSHLAWFAAGMALAAFEPELRGTAPALGWARDLVARPGTLLLLAAALFLVGATTVGGPVGLFSVDPWRAVAKEALYAAVAGLLVLGAALSDASRGPWSVLASPPARFLGRVSYGVFLWHLVVLDLVMRALGLPEFTGNMGAVAALTIIGSVIVAAVSFHVVERPFLHRVGARWG